MNPARPTTAAATTAVVLATAAGLLSATAAPATAATTCASPVYTRQFFANTSFSGTPKKTDCDAAIDQNWGTGAPASGLPRDNFGVRWTVTRDFGSGGPFALPVATQDGVRVHLDGVRKVDLWKNVSTTVKKTVNITIPSGRHTLRVDYVNWTGTANVSFAYKPRTSADVDKVSPLAPTGTSVAYDSTAGKAKFSWPGNKEMDLAGYRVYRRLKGTSFGATPLATTTSTSYTDTSLPVTGDTYYYEVRAYDKAGNTSAGSADQGVTTADRTAPARVTGLTAEGTTAGNTVAWEPSSAADVHHYEVWGAPEGQQDPDGPETVFGTSFTDVTAGTGTPYTYTVHAVDGAGNVSPVSATVTATRPEPSGTPAPTGLTSVLQDDRTEIHWVLPEDAPQYRVYRRTDGGWTAIGNLHGGWWEDRLAPAGKASYYVVAVDAGTGAESAPSAEITVDRLARATPFGPAAPQLTLVTAGIPARQAVQIKAAPGAGDEGRVLKGYSWEISGACGDSGTLLSATGSLSWTPPYNGPCTATVYAVDPYGRQSAQSSSLEFFVGR